MYMEMSFSLHLSVVHISSMDSLLIGDTNSTKTTANSGFPASQLPLTYSAALSLRHIHIPCLLLALRCPA